jgi:radical SAM-linked protein
MRFTSHRDCARAFERALVRARVPIAYSQGFTAHPKISYASAAPTGVASEAEYLELGLQEVVDPADLARALDAALSAGLDVLEAVPAEVGSLADRINASRWRIELAGLPTAPVSQAVDVFMAAGDVPVRRLTKQGWRILDARSPVVTLRLATTEPDPAEPGENVAAPSAAGEPACAILDLVIRQVTPSVRPDDVLTGLRVVAGLTAPEPARVTRLAQGTLTAPDGITDPLHADREADIVGVPAHQPRPADFGTRIDHAGTGST